jgi:hypothetical protein
LVDSALVGLAHRCEEGAVAGLDVNLMLRVALVISAAEHHARWWRRGRHFS